MSLRTHFSTDVWNDVQTTVISYVIPPVQSRGLHAQRHKRNGYKARIQKFGFFLIQDQSLSENFLQTWLDIHQKPVWHVLDSTSVFCLSVLTAESHFQSVKYIYFDTKRTVVILTVSHSLNVSSIQFLVSDSTKGLQVTLVH